MPRKEYHYGHDLHGATMRGHVRRAYEAAFKLLRAANGWSDPMEVREDHQDAGFGLALDTLIEAYEHEGLNPDDIFGTLKREVDRWNSSFNGHRPLSDRDRERMKERLAAEREDPVETGGIGWEEFDDYVDELGREAKRRGRSYAIDTLTHGLKSEARIRHQAQAEAAALRKDGA